MARTAAVPAPPRTLPPDLPATLESVPGIAARSETVASEIADLTGVLASEHAHLLESRVARARLDEWRLTGATLTDVSLTDVAAGALIVVDGRWRQTQWCGGRASTFEAVRLTGDGVRFEGIRFDYANLAAARLTDVAFVDCVFTTLDLPQASLERVAFERCRADEVDTRGLVARDLDLRGLDASRFTDVTGLRGAVLSSHQAAFHADALARSIGITVA